MVRTACNRNFNSLWITVALLVAGATLSSRKRAIAAELLPLVCSCAVTTLHTAALASALQYSIDGDLYKSVAAS